MSFSSFANLIHQSLSFKYAETSPVISVNIIQSLSDGNG